MVVGGWVCALAPGGWRNGGAHGFGFVTFSSLCVLLLHIYRIFLIDFLLCFVEVEVEEVVAGIGWKLEVGSRWGG